MMPCLGESVPVCRRASLNAHQTDALQEQKSTVDPKNSESLDKLNKIEIWGRKKGLKGRIVSLEQEIHIMDLQLTNIELLM